MRTVKTLIRLGGCPGWSEASLGTLAILLVLSWGGSDVKGSAKAIIFIYLFFPVCPESVNILAIVLGTIIGIVVIGLILLLIWRLFTTIHDRREFAKFEKETQNAKFDTVCCFYLAEIKISINCCTISSIKGRGSETIKIGEWSVTNVARTLCLPRDNKISFISKADTKMKVFPKPNFWCKLSKLDKTQRSYCKKMENQETPSWETASQ